MRAHSLVLLLAAGPAEAGELSPHLRLNGERLQKDPVRVHAILRERPTAALRGALSAAGARPVELAEGGLAEVGRVLCLEVPRARLEAVAAVPGVLRVDPARPILALPPLDRTALRIGAPAVWSSRVPTDLRDLGQGAVLADHEGGWDPFHPDFFLPDAGLHDWIDVDGDGALGAGDAVVIDGRRRALSILESGLDDLYDGTSAPSGPGLQPSIDWLYVDLDGDGQRDFGPGFGREPALGEPLFAADDVDGDGVVRLGERLLRLGTPKVRAIHELGRVFLRGVDLEQYRPSGDTFHGTGAAGIAVAGWPELRRFVGVAPAAELVLVNAMDPVEGLAASERLGANLDMFEFSSLVELHDGSSALETAISDAAAQGRVQLAATGNLTGSGHNLRVALRAGAPTALPFETGSPSTAAPNVVIITLTWLGDPADVEASIVSDAGERAALPELGDLTFAGLSLQTGRDRSPRGTAIVFLAMDGGGGPIPPRGFTLELRARVEIPELRGQIVDDAAGWGRGAAWRSNLSERGTALVPSTADRVIAVGAFGELHDLASLGDLPPGPVRRYSGRGPRLDGALVVDLVAPDDPFAPTPGARYASFGGTSGALPHAAGAAALAWARGARSHDTVERTLVASAGSDDFTRMLPNAEAGFGKLRADPTASLGGLREPPRLRLTVEGTPGPRARLRVIAEAEDLEGGPVRVDWDEGYDRVYEGSTRPPHRWPLELDAEGRGALVARAVGRDGQSRRALVRFDGAPACTPDACQGCCRPDGSCGPCASDAGVGADRRAPAPIDAGAGIDAGLRPLDGAFEDASFPRRKLETIGEAELSCGCAGARDPSGALGLVSLALALGRIRNSRRR